MSKRSKNLSLDDGVLDLAEQIIVLRRFPNLVTCLEQLIREEHERRNGAATFLRDAPNAKLSAEVKQQVVSIVEAEVQKRLNSYKSPPPGKSS